MTDERARRAGLTMIDKAIRAAGRKIHLYSEKRRNEMLEYAADDKAEAYLIGVEECQGELLSRLQAIRRTLIPSTPPPVGHLEKQRDADCGRDERKIAP